MRGLQAMGIQSAAPAQVVGQISSGHAMKLVEPLAQAAVIRIDVLHMECALDANTCGQIDRFMRDAGSALQLARTLVGFEQIRLVGLGNAAQVGGAIIFGPLQEAVAPTKAGVAMDTAVRAACRMVWESSMHCR